ncbi:hypothetical protein AAK899_11435 [Erysipelotrichaceae bacterium 51-3]
MNTSYYSALSAGLSRFASSLPDWLESEEKAAIHAAISQIRSWIAQQIQEIREIEDAARHRNM